MLGRFVSGVCVCAASARRGARRTNRLPVRPAGCARPTDGCASVLTPPAWRRVMYCRETVSIVRPPPGLPDRTERVIRQDRRQSGPPSTRLVRVDGSLPGRDSEVVEVESIVYDTSYDPEPVMLRPWYTRRPWRRGDTERTSSHRVCLRRRQKPSLLRPAVATMPRATDAGSDTCPGCVVALRASWLQ
jgi:hypothetical protein